MSLPEISIRRPVFAWMLMMAMLVFGWIGLTRLGISNLPDVDFPVVSINLSLEGAAPEVMEVDVVDPVEDALTAIQGVTAMSSSSRTGSAGITLEFDLSKNIDVAVQEVQSVLSQVARRLPKEMDPPTVRKTNPEDQPILWIAISSATKSEVELMTFVRDQVKDQFSTLPGVGETLLGGFVDPALRVWLSSKQLSQYALTVSDILGTIQQEHSETPSGRIESSDREVNIRTMGEAPTAEEFGKISITRRGGSPNYAALSLGQVSQVEDGLNDIRRKSRSNGIPAVGIGIKKQRGANSVSVATAVKEKLALLKKSMPEGINIDIRVDSTTFIQESVHELNFTLLLSAILTALICWLFLGSWSATLNVVMAIPTSIVGSFFILYLLGFTLNTFTLLGLSLAIGIVVDDAIMVLENIARHQEEGKSRMDAALIGAREITFAAIAATAAIIAIFLPVAFMQGLIGKYFYQFGVTLSVAVALSLLEALTLTPMRCSRYLKLEPRSSWLGRKVEGFFAKTATIYSRILKHIVRRPKSVILLSVLVFAASLGIGIKIKKEFVPTQDQGRIMARLQTPPGSSLQVTDQKLAAMEAVLKDDPSVAEYFGSVGGWGSGEVNSGNVFINLKPVPERAVNSKTGKPYTHTEVMAELREKLKAIPDARITLMDPSLSGFSSRRGFPIEFTVRGPDWNKLVELSQTFAEELKKTGDLHDVDTDYQAGLPEIRVTPDREKARQRGVSIVSIGETVNALMGGVIAGKFSKNGHRYDIRVRLKPSERSSSEDINGLMVRNNRGEMIPLSELVKIREEKSLQSISRIDRERAISIFANVAPHTSQADAIDKVNALAQKLLPPGYRAVMGGSAKTFKESFQGLWVALGLGILISYMILGSQFNSFRHPWTVLVALPFSVSGAFLALLIWGQSLNIYSMIGLILLMGIVKKNSILLVDFANQLKERDHKLSTIDAVLQGSPLRLRPILMTSIATVVGALPAVFAWGPGAESRVSMAVAVVGGVILSTILTLLVVPCVYLVLDRKVAK